MLGDGGTDWLQQGLETAGDAGGIELVDIGFDHEVIGVGDDEKLGLRIDQLPLVDAARQNHARDRRGDGILGALLFYLVQSGLQARGLIGGGSQRQLGILQAGTGGIVAQGPGALGGGGGLALLDLLGIERRLGLLPLRLHQSRIEFDQHLPRRDLIALGSTDQHRLRGDRGAHRHRGAGGDAPIDREHLRYRSCCHGFGGDQIGPGLPGAFEPGIGAPAADQQQRKHQPAPTALAPLEDGTGGFFGSGHSTPAF